MGMSIFQSIFARLTVYYTKLYLSRLANEVGNTFRYIRLQLHEICTIIVE